MLRLLQYLKPYLIVILLTIILLFVQANADLALPDYLSKIVNNGIQQGGVENAVPVAIRQSEMDRLLIFISAEEKALISDATSWWIKILRITTSTSRNIRPWPMSRSMYAKIWIKRKSTS